MNLNQASPLRALTSVPRGNVAAVTRPNAVSSQQPAKIWTFYLRLTEGRTQMSSASSDGIRGSFPAVMSSESLFLYFSINSWNMFHLASRMDSSFMARWNCKHPWILNSESILFWIPGGNRAPVNNTLPPVLLEAFVERPEAVAGEIVKTVGLFLMAKCQPRRETLAAFVCAQRPWTSLACVLINSLLVIPSGEACWDPSPVPPPIPRLIPSVSLFLSVASEPHSSFKASTEASSFFSSRWSADYIRTCVQMSPRQLKPLSYFCQ